MTLFWTMLPFYLMGNMHCLGMCGPLVMMIGRHRYRYAYFFGRLFSFGLAGMAAGEAGAVLQGSLQTYHIPEMLTFALGILMLGVAANNWMGWSFSLPLPKAFRQVNHSISLLMLKDTILTTFLFGLLTVALPCGQSLIVFSACALAGDPWVGLFNGLAFALLTSPSLWVAMHTLRWFQSAKSHHRRLVAGAAFFAGTMAVCRGLADLGAIPHFVMGNQASYHIVLY